MTTRPNAPADTATASPTTNPTPVVPELVMTRTLEAPRALVFQAFADAERLAHWWGPTGFEVEIRRLEFRPGGIFHYRMANAEGFEMWGRFVYREIVEPERIVWVNAFSDPEAGLVRAPFGLTIPLEMLNTITLEEQGNRTVLRLHSTPINATEEERATFTELLGSMQQGWGGTLDQLAARLAEWQAA
jgi:uncharacterized protein YndB with AHSA1/START domain